MNSKKVILLPTNAKLLEELGQNLRLARKRRKLTAEQVAERSGIARSTLWNIERGDPGVAIGSYMQVLFVLGLEKDINKVASDDLLGRKLEDAKYLHAKLAPARKASGMKSGIMKPNRMKKS
ncbi:helix-turn-helix domain-containing protein [Chitinophaga eiseniae]|uniref:helix-turn-helix domain-containing protein n=1 Tax=Chitinophaga eiseniae TaxID=634771 RepID=UPI00099AAC13|nr:XRE family transcriptional regulator [Chitinophaga eiseniae]